jgi:D-cysteine desulfhydrase
MMSDPDRVAGKIRAALAPRSLGLWPTPLEAHAALAAVAGLDALWLKREDRSAPGYGGSKVRGLEFLFADAPRGTAFVTIGGTGSTHCLATAVHARRLGAAAALAQFPQPHTDGAAAVAAACSAWAPVVVRPATRAGLPLAVVRAWRAAGRLGPRRWLPGGGAHPRAVIGHFLAGLELAAQLPAPPHAIVAALGSTGTVAGLTLAVAALQWPTTVVAVRVAPRLVANAWRARRLAGGARRLLARIGVAVPVPRAPLVVHGLGAGYGYPTAAGEEARRVAQQLGLELDATYTAKAFAAVPALAPRGFRHIVFWHTFAPPPPPPPSPPFSTSTGPEPTA